MSVSIKNEFQISATPGEELSRHLAYLAAQDNGSILTGGFIKDAATLEREGSDRAGQQAATAMEFLARQEQLRQQRFMFHIASERQRMTAACRQGVISLVRRANPHGRGAHARSAHHRLRSCKE